MIEVTDQIRKMDNVELFQSRNFQEGRLLQVKEESHFEDLELCRRILFETYQELERRGLS